MFRAGSGGGDMGGGSYELVTHVITNNQVFTMPENVKDGQIHVRIFGAGGGGYHATSSWSNPDSAAGGGGGYMNNGWISLAAGSTVEITIGKGTANAGGVTLFGTYLSANGGQAGSGASGGNGGSGGGGSYHGGFGYQFGSGGGADGTTYYIGGNAVSLWGGNGGSWSKSAKDGTNTIGIISEDDMINANGIGYGKAGINQCAGGGGYGANGGNGGWANEENCGGGGGG